MTRDRLPPGLPSAPAFAGSATSRIEVSRGLLHTAFAEGSRICVLGSGDFLEGARLLGRDLSNVTLVDADKACLERARQSHRSQIVTECADPATFLHRARRRREHYDLIYALFLPETLSASAFVEMLGSVMASLTASGQALFANSSAGPIAPESSGRHRSDGRVLRSPDELMSLAGKAGLTAKAWLDPPGGTAFALIRPPRDPAPAAST